MEKQYVEDEVRNEPDMINKQKVKRYIQREPRFNKQFNGETTVYLVNYQYENNPNHILQKLISLVNVMPTRLMLVIITMPQDATYVDTTMAEQLQRVMWTKH